MDMVLLCVPVFVFFLAALLVSSSLFFSVNFDLTSDSGSVRLFPDPSGWDMSSETGTKKQEKSTNQQTRQASYTQSKVPMVIWVYVSLQVATAIALFTFPSAPAARCRFTLSLTSHFRGKASFGRNPERETNLEAKQRTNPTPVRVLGVSAVRSRREGGEGGFTVPIRTERAAAGLGILILILGIGT